VCGIAGCVDFGKRIGLDELLAIAREMSSAQKHRGPDDSGAWADPAGGVALGHRRLAILDLSPSGHQPMTSSNGRYVICYNGEIYNYLELRAELIDRGHCFRGRSDTEVVLAAVCEWGLPRALVRFNGMFAIALWDRAEMCLYLARDRFGEKPIFYGVAGNSLVFASELKAIRAHPDFTPTVDREALTEFLRFGYVPTPRSIFVGIRKLPPATWLRIATREDVAAAPQEYWRASDAIVRGLSNRFSGSFAAACDEVERLLRDSIRVRMLSDVPLGAFLSGGIDSSTVVALMQAQSTQRVRTFTIGFHEDAYNEATMANAVARHLGTDHSELYVTPKDAQAVIPKLPSLYDEPFADSSQIPTFLVAQLARREVTVALSGDGGDEIFGGYTRYLWAHDIWGLIRRGPTLLKRALHSVILSTLSVRSESHLEALGRFLPARLRQRLPGAKLRKLANLLGARTTHELYHRLVSTWYEPANVVLNGSEKIHFLTRDARALGVTDFSEQMMFSDIVSYLPDDILVKVDRATMGASLEGRMPLLDPHLFEFAWSLPLQMKVVDRRGKQPLRRILAKYLPIKLFERPKMGFGIPIGGWIRGPLRGWSESLLDERRLRDEGFLDPAVVQAAWRDHLSGAPGNESALWFLLMFQAWLEELRRGGRSPEARHATPGGAVGQRPAPAA
jgi:asparagine synthase (glutamine-hydrolysing)